MRVASILSPLLVAMVCLEPGAEAGFLGAAIRTGVSRGITAAVSQMLRNAVRNQSMLRNASLRGSVGETIRGATNAARGRAALSAETKKFLKYSVITAVISGSTSGSISGTISKNAKARRSWSDRAMMMSRQLFAEGDEDVGEPGPAPENVSQDAWDLCFWDLVVDADVNVAGENDWIEVQGLPPACGFINDKLAEVAEGGAGINCGEECIRYEGLTPEELAAFSDYLAGLQ